MIIVTPEVKEITRRLSQEVSNLSVTKWNKFMFFIDGAYYALHGEQISDFTYIKLQYGPVPRSYNHVINSLVESKVIALRRGVEASMTYLNPGNDRDEKQIASLPESASEIVTKAIGVFKTWTAARMSDLSHELKAWKTPQLGDPIDLKELCDDDFLKEKYQEKNWGSLLLKQ